MRKAAVPAVLAVILTVGCAPAPQDHTSAIAADSPPSAPPAASASAAAPVVTASAAPSAVSVPAPSASVDRKTCHSVGPAVTFEVTDDDHVVSLDASGCPTGESWCKGPLRGYKGYVELVTKLQALVKAGDKEALADFVDYPLRINVKNKPSLSASDRADFLRKFSMIYPASVVDAVVKADPRDLICTSKGIGFARGTIWFDDDSKGHLGVMAVNPP